MGHGFLGVAIVARLAEVTVPTSRVVTTVHADTATPVPAQTEQLHIEVASLRVQITVAG